MGVAVITFTDLIGDVIIVPSPLAIIAICMSKNDDAPCQVLLQSGVFLQVTRATAKRITQDLVVKET